MFDTASDPCPDLMTDGRYEQKKADGIGDEAGRNEQYSGDNDHNSINHPRSRHTPFCKITLDIAEDHEALLTCQCCADEAGDDYKSHSVYATNMIVDTEKDHDLKNRHKDEEC